MKTLRKADRKVCFYYSKIPQVRPLNQALAAKKWLLLKDDILTEICKDYSPCVGSNDFYEIFRLLPCFGWNFWR